MRILRADSTITSLHIAQVVQVKKAVLPLLWIQTRLYDMDFQITSQYQPTYDQPEAIAELVNGVTSGASRQTLLGVTYFRQDIYNG